MLTLKQIWAIYRDGFRDMTIGKTLWIIVAVKLAVLFLVFKLFFFPDILDRDCDSDQEKAEMVRQNLTRQK